MKIAYALVFVPAAVLIIWCICGAVFGYKFEFISSLSDHKLRYGADAVSEVIDALVICTICTPIMWIAAAVWIFTNLHFVARITAYIKTRNFDMSQLAQDVFTIAVVIMDMMFLFGILRVI